MSISNLILPNNITIDKHFWSTFDGDAETEVSARWIVMFLQARNSVGEGKGWDSFPVNRLVPFYQKLRNQPQEGFNFNRLDEKYLLRVQGVVTVTDRFVSAIASQSHLISGAILLTPKKYILAYIESIK